MTAPGKVLKGGGYGVAVDIVVGIVGAVSGALVFRRIAQLLPFADCLARS